MKRCLVILVVSGALFSGCFSEKESTGPPNPLDAYVWDEQGFRLDPSLLPGVPDLGDEDVDCKKIGTVVQITGDDRYNLDEDGNGIGCEEFLPSEEEVSELLSEAIPNSY